MHTAQVRGGSTARQGPAPRVARGELQQEKRIEGEAVRVCVCVRACIAVCVSLFFCLSFSSPSLGMCAVVWNACLLGSLCWKLGDSVLFIFGTFCLRLVLQNVTSLPMLAYMEYTVAQTITKALTAVGLKRPKHPFLTAKQSALLYVATYLKAHNQGYE